MTRDEAISITQMVLDNWTHPEWSVGQTEAFVRAIERYDAERLVQAVAAAHKHLQYRPSFKDVREFYLATAPAAPAPAAVKPTRMPVWVKRWAAARWLHSHFNRDQDMRPFPEQHGHIDPLAELMPAGEWEHEASQISDRQAWVAIRGEA